MPPSGMDDTKVNWYVTPADLLSLFFLFSLKAGVVPPERHETQPVRTKWTLDVKN